MSAQTNQILLVPEKPDVERDKVIAAWTERGGSVRRLGKYWIKDEQLAASPLVIYGNQTFALILAQIYNLSLISPDDTLLARLDEKWTKRKIQVSRVTDAKDLHFPVFIKPVIPKLFQAGLFQSINEFKVVVEGIAQNEEVLISEVVSIEAEARAYILDNVVMDVAVYEGEANVEEAASFLHSFVQANTNLPKTLVIDLAYNNSIGWFILEFNASWGAGLNGCDARKVIECIAAATHHKT